MVIGGVAAIAHGVLRTTRDVDATIVGEGTDLDPLIARLREHDIVPRIDNAVAFARESHVLLLRHAPSNVDVDLSLAWIEFELDAIAAADEAVVAGTTIRAVNPEDLIIYKLVAWRARDRDDIERLLQLHAERIDLSRVRQLAKELAEALDDPLRPDELERIIDRAAGTAPPGDRRGK